MKLNSCKSLRKKVFGSYVCSSFNNTELFTNNFAYINSCMITIHLILSVGWDLYVLILKTKDTYMHFKGLISWITIYTVFNNLNIFPVQNLFTVLQF